MAYIVLVAGAFMALLGALAIITGYPIIQIERGWATVIAGTTLLAGGFVTMALGLVLRAVTDLRAALANTPFASPFYTAPATDAASHAEPDFGVEPTPTQTDATPTHGDTALGATAVALPLTALAVATRHEAEPEVSRAPAVPQVEEPVHAAAPDEPVDTKHQDAPLESPPIDDWLDKAFADLSLPSRAAQVDHGSTTQVEPERLPDPLVAAQHDGDLRYAEAHEATPRSLHDDEIHHAEPLPEPVRHETEHELQVHYADPAEAEQVDHEPTPPAKPAPASSDEPAVIGRYEADGTAYTMFADGSIEAQSDAGIYRFASMADLKAFIEG